MNKTKKDNPLLDILFNIAAPSLILMKLSSTEYLGAVLGLVVALAFPIGYAVFSFIRVKKLNLFSVFGFLSTLLTGGIALFELDTHWLAIKEASIPAIIAFIVFISGFFGKPLLARLILNPTLFKVTEIYDVLDQRGNTKRFKQNINNANIILATTFIFSAVMNYLLAIWVVTSPTGTPEFNEQLGQMTMLSYPVIAIPSLIMMLGLMFYVSKMISKLTGMEFNQLINEKNEVR
jgi:hypothetical protein